MLLSNEDVSRLESKGYDREFFSVCDSQGFIFLRNVDGCCVFYDAEKQLCRIRGNRPSGCRVYPVIYDEAEGIVVDDICPAKGSITEKQKAKRGKKVLKLLERIDAEAKKRHVK
jgi:Fe-S-cluster containining protein